MERSGLDEINLRRARRAFMDRWRTMNLTVKITLRDGSICERYRFVTDLLVEAWSPEVWQCWLRYLEHSEQDIAEMRQGEYPISPYIVRLFSALLGIKVDFLLLGAWPTSDQVGASIDIYPAAGVHA